MLRKATIALISLCLLIPLVNTSATSDVGDGLEACNYGEICLHEETVGEESAARIERYRKHFWWNAWHSSYHWWDAWGNYYVSRRVHNSAGTIRNRDSTCYVSVRAYIGPAQFREHVVPNDGLRYTLNSLVHGANDRHYRCP